MESNRYEILGCPLEAIKGFERQCLEQFRGLGSYGRSPSGEVPRSDDIRLAEGLAVLCHLGVTSHPVLAKRIREGFDVALDFFLGNWWKSDKYGDRIHKYSETFDILLTITPFSSGLLLGMLAATWGDVAKLCTWMEADLGRLCTPGVFQLYMSLSASLRPEPMPGLAEQEERVLSGRQKDPKVLMRAWLAARSGDQVGFEKGIRTALDRFAQTYLKPGPRPISSWIAKEESMIVMAATRLGLQFPRDLPPRLSAMVMTRESLGLGPE